MTTTVTLADGERGVLADDFEAGQPGKVLVRMGSGQQVLVPVSALVAEGDHYRLPFRAGDLEEAGSAARNGDGVVIPVTEETLNVTRETVVTGGVRLIKRISEREETVDEPLLQTHVSVERVPINRVVSEAPAQRYEEDILVLSVVEEVLVVEKRLMLKEEIRIQTTQTQTSRPAAGHPSRGGGGRRRDRPRPAARLVRSKTQQDNKSRDNRRKQMAKTVVGLFDNFSEAQSVVQDLVDGGFRREDISIAANQAATGYTGDDTTTGTTGTGGHAVGKDAGIGAGIGGAIGLLVGLGALAIPGIGPVLAAGPLAAAFGVTLGSTVTGAALGGVVGGLVGALTHIGVPQEHAEYYAEGVRRGGTLVTVNAPDNQAEQAVSILNGHGAVDIEDRGNTYRTGGYTGYTETAPAYTAEDITRERSQYAPKAADTTGETVIPITEEQLAVGKRQVQSGGARIHTFVTETPVEQSVNLHEEHVTVDRRPVDRAVTGADTANFREGTIEVTETAEVPVIAKEARVVEEVVVGKTATDRTETVRDTVRRTDVEVEEIPGTTTTTGTTTTGTTKF